MDRDREAPNLAELLSFAAALPTGRAEQLIVSAHPAPLEPPNDDAEPPAPTFISWDNYLAATTVDHRLRWCRAKVKTANRRRLMSGPSDRKITAAEVWSILEHAKGRCAHCGSLAVELRPSGPNGRPTAWGSIGRRIGSLGHSLARFNGGQNNPDNLCWSCLWCNTWPSERHNGATDHGGIQMYNPDLRSR
ncbi:hypothetical protein [Virgisporangium aurantiacum]|uniref:HNH endonuclease n=1 Tax=Virgisporangium aurantiacum TaxID=175570 RepID=A0A8J4E7F0_9ACTN|nr:hypothetical protein [Virgisporangium aurantiacum]GIJ65035.1 hypothetical protein Vau01_125510 [Virgisporangium aurantiacum]